MKRLGRRVATTLATLAAVIAPASTASGHPVVFVANAKAGTVQIIDALTFAIERTIDVVPDGKPRLDETSLERDPTQTANAILVNGAVGDNFVQDLDISPDGGTLYVSRGNMADVAAFDVTRDPAEMIWSTRVDGFRADHMTISDDGDTLYVSDLTEYEGIALRASDGSRIGSFPTGQYSHGMTFVVAGDLPASASSENERTSAADCAFFSDTPGGSPTRCIYNMSIGDITLFPRELRDNQPDEANVVLSEPYQITIADAVSLEVVRALELAAGIRPAAMSLTGEDKILYYQESFFHGIVEYDLVAGRERRRVQLPIDDAVEEDDYSFESPHHGLAISPDGSLLCAAGRASDYAALVSTETMLAEAIIDVGDAPGWAITEPTGNNCWIANTGSDAPEGEPPADTVSVISYAEVPGGSRLVATIETDAGPKHLLAADVPLGVLSPTE